MIHPVSPHCEYRTSPLGIDTPHPRFSWIIRPDTENDRGGKQLAYHILAATSPESLQQDRADLWDSSEVASSQTAHVPYSGKPLSSAQQVWWKMRVLDQQQWSGWSEPAHFTMGLLKREDWLAQWIGVNPLSYQSKSLPIFRREFRLDRLPKRAVVFVCGLGQFELRLNGHKVGNNELDPGWTNYRKTCLYVTHDVTSLLREGPNVLGVMLGNGMYNVGSSTRYKKFKASFGQPKFLLQMHTEPGHGTKALVVSDESWRAAPGPITFGCIFGGEDFDASQEQPGWDQAGFDDQHWQHAIPVDAPPGDLRSQTAPPSRVMKRFEPVHITQVAPDVAVYDLGQNFSGWPCVTTRGESQANLTFITGELLDASGRVSQASSGSPVSFGYTGDGKPRTWHPRFSYTGFRYVEARGDLSAIESLAGEFVHSSAAVVGKFKCSKPLFNQIHDLINAAILSNMQSVLSDCPHREKLGWLEQSWLMGPAVMLNYDVPLLFKKICADMREAQWEDGCIPTIAPEYVQFKGQWADFSNSPEWGSAAVVNPWLMFQHYGDVDILRENYPMMRRYVDYLQSREQEGLIDFGLGDWYDIGPGDPGYAKLTSKALTATAVYYLDLQTLKKVSALLGDASEAQRLADRAERVRTAFNQRLFDAGTGQYDRHSQTANAMALALGLVEPSNAGRVLENLIADIRSRDNHVTAGDIGFRFVIDALAAAGRSDVIFDLLSRTDAPSYGAQLAAGATTLTEAWDANPKNSQNHLMLGHAELWFYRDLAGLCVDFSREPDQQIIIRPAVVGDITWAQAEYDSVRGRIGCRWERSDHRLHVAIEIPFNCSATAYLPAPEAGALREGGRPIADRSDLRLVTIASGLAELPLGAGSYHFETDVPTG
jgi:hypothetical protein